MTNGKQKQNIDGRPYEEKRESNIYFFFIVRLLESPDRMVYFKSRVSWFLSLFLQRQKLNKAIKHPVPPCQVKGRKVPDRMVYFGHRILSGARRSQRWGMVLSAEAAESGLCPEGNYRPKKIVFLFLPFPKLDWIRVKILYFLPEVYCANMTFFLNVFRRVMVLGMMK